MKCFVCYAQRLLILCALLSFVSCSKTSREWSYQQVLTSSPRFNFARLFLPSDSDPPRLTMEIVRGRTGIKLYLNVLFLQAPPCKENPHVTKVDIIFEEQSRSLYPQILKGGQRLFFSFEDTDFIIQTLLEGLSFTIKLGRQELFITTENFSKAYTELMSIPIEECSKKAE
jgi:hypothetical protein